jgi:sugar phosphate permease
MAKRSRFFYGWLILGCAVLVMALASGTRMSFGIAMLPLSEQFGWTRTLLSTIALITGIIGGLLQMGMGLLVDRYGANESTPLPRPTTTASAGIPLSQAVRTMQMGKLIYLGFA